MATKFDEYVERLAEERRKRQNEEINRALAIGLATRTREQVIAQMLGELTFIVGTGTVLTANEGAKSAEMVVF